MSNLIKHLLCFIQSFLSSNLGIFYFGLFLFCFFVKIFLRISLIYCVSWINKFFGKISPINGFDMFLPAIAALSSLIWSNELGPILTFWLVKLSSILVDFLKLQNYFDVIV